jgi:hypothetical protein
MPLLVGDARGVYVGGESYRPPPTVATPTRAYIAQEESLEVADRDSPTVVVVDPIPPRRPRAPTSVVLDPLPPEDGPRIRAPIVAPPTPVDETTRTIPTPNVPTVTPPKNGALKMNLGLNRGGGLGSSPIMGLTYQPPPGFLPMDGRGGLTGVGISGCEALGVPRSICEAGADAINSFLGRGGSSTGSSSPATQLVAGCPDGYVNVNGRCEREGIGGAIQRFLPGGRTGTLADQYGEAVLGAFGIPGIMPSVVGQRQNARGEVNPILECPPGAVLGKDNVCYMKGSIPRKFRKWPPAPRAPVTAGDAKAIRKAERARGRVKKLAGNVGFKCSPKRGR